MCRKSELAQSKDEVNSINHEFLSLHMLILSGISISSHLPAKFPPTARDTQILAYPNITPVMGMVFHVILRAKSSTGIHQRKSHM